MTATYQMAAADLGWDYFEKLAKQKVMQVQSSADPPKKKLALGERRAVMADGNEVQHIHRGRREGDTGGDRLCDRRGRPLIVGPNGLFKKRAQSERRARLFQSFLLFPSGGRNSSASMSQACDRCIRRPKTSQGRQTLPGENQEDERTIPEGVRKAERQKSRGRGYSKLFGV